MSEQYRLVYSGEIIEGQHASVVKKRLAAILKLDDERMDVLFSGKPVVVKKATDDKNAARYQEVFKKAGARLRVLPVEGGAASTAAGEPEKATATQPSSTASPIADSSSPPPASSSPSQAPPSQPQSPPPAATPSSAPSEDGLSVLPTGSDVLTDSERPEHEPTDVDTSHLGVQGAVFHVDEPETPHDVPNVDHLTLAELGAMLGQGNTEEVVLVEIDVDFDLAEVGAILGAVDAAVPASPINVDDVNFDLAEPGVILGSPKMSEPPNPPDTSHLELDKDQT